MREYLTIGEVSKLLKISSHNIRYYEKEGLIKPSFVSEAGYRLYDYDDVYELSAIMLLRDSDIPIKQIKKLFENYTGEGYIELLKRSFEKVSEQIDKLTVLKNQIEKSLHSAQNIDSNSVFKNKQIPKRCLKVLKRSDYEMDYSIKEFYDIYRNNNIDSNQFYKEDSIYYLTEEDISYCIQDDEDKYGLDSIELKEGKYLCYSYFSSEDDTAKRIDDLFEYIINNELETEGDLVMIIGVKASLISDTDICGELQIKLK